MLAVAAADARSVSPLSEVRNGPPGPKPMPAWNTQVPTTWPFAIFPPSSGAKFEEIML
jgi:hypothetical protein